MGKAYIEILKTRIAEFCKKWKPSMKMLGILYLILSTWKTNSKRFSGAKLT